MCDGGGSGVCVCGGGGAALLPDACKTSDMESMAGGRPAKTRRQGTQHNCL